MNDDDLIRELRATAKRADEAPTGTPLDAPLGEAFEARVAARIGASRRGARGRLRVLAFATPLAAAAALALWLARPHASLAPLPAYALEVSGAQDTERGADRVSGSPVVARADASLALLLRPTEDVTGPLEVHTFASHAGVVHEVIVATRTSPSGSVEIRARATDLAGPDGATVLVVVGRAGTGGEARGIAESGNAPAGFRLARVEISVAP